MNKKLLRLILAVLALPVVLAFAPHNEWWSEPSAPPGRWPVPGVRGPSPFFPEPYFGLPPNCHTLGNQPVAGHWVWPSAPRPSALGAMTVLRDPCPWCRVPYCLSGQETLGELPVPKRPGEIVARYLPIAPSPPSIRE